MWRRWGTHQNFCLVNLRNKYLLKNLLKWANKKFKNFNIYNVLFFYKNNEKHLEIIMDNFLPFYPPPPSLPKTPKIRILKKWKKLLEISSFYRCEPKTTIICGTVPEIQSETDIIFLSFWEFSALYPPPPSSPLP